MDNAVSRGTDINKISTEIVRKNRFDLGVIWRLIMFLILSQAVSTPLRMLFVPQRSISAQHLR